MAMRDRIKTMTGQHWIVLFLLILVGWVAVFFMAAPAELREMQAIYGAEFWESLCTVTPDAAGYARLVLMWSIMAAAMMLPTMLPTLSTYDDLAVSTRAGFHQITAGYLIVWLGFALLAAALQMALMLSGFVSAIGSSTSKWFSAALLIGAGAYQFSLIKDACLSKCRLPLTFFMENWADTRWNALNMGLRLGAICLGCCWALMLLGFVGGVMNVAWMGLAMLLMVLEKLPDIGKYITRPLGVVLILAGVLWPLIGG